jgi:hypothetical protein
VVALVVLGAVAAATAAAQTVPVTLGLSGGSRTLLLRTADDAGPLTSFSYSGSGAAPFLVKVVDDAMDRTSFDVTATMTNLYRYTGSTPWDDSVSPIASSNLGIDVPANPLTVSGIEAQVQTLVNLTATLPNTICTGAVLIAIPSCSVTLNGLTSKVLSVVPSDLSVLANLPLIPQQPSVGAFTNPDYTNDTPNAPNTWTPTALSLLSGDPGTAGALLDELETQLQALVNTLDVTDVVNQDDIIAALPAILSGVAAAVITDSTWAVDVVDVASGDIVSQSGTYRSYPILDLDVPSGATAATYKGTLIVTGIQ